jgi:hypothetical protein
MIPCMKCGHQNLPSYPTCGKCGASLAGAAAALAEEAVRAQRYEAEAKGRRNRVLYTGFGLVALVAFGAWYMKDSRSKGDLQSKLDFAGRWVELEKKETGQFWSCVMASEVDVGMFSNAGQIQQRLEAAYLTQQKTFSDHLLTECVPKMERAREAFASLADPPPELKGPMDAYKKTLPELQDGIEVYADRIKNRDSTKSVDQLIQELGNNWHTDSKPTPEAVAFDKFLQCAIPEWPKLKDVQALLELLAQTCYKKDPVSFMDRIRKDCGPLLTNVTAAAPSKSYKLVQKKFFEEDARQLRAWEDCGRKARRGKKVEDLGEFLVAVGEYMGARAAVGKAARELSDSR